MYLSRNYHLQSLEQGNVFNHVCHSVQKGGDSFPSMHHFQMIRGRGGDPLPPGTGKAGGTHPTGMLPGSELKSVSRN